MVHAIEAFISNASSSVTDISALVATFLLAKNLIPAMEYRNNMMLGSLLAGMAFSNASLGLVHSMAHKEKPNGSKAVG